MSIEQFEMRCVCDCGWVANDKCPFGDKIHFYIDVCPRCGGDKSAMWVKTLKWVATHVWYKPSTWGDGSWRTPNGEKVGR